MKIDDFLIEERKTPQRGTYAAVKANQETKDKLEAYMEKNKIPTPVKVDKLHVTLIYSRKHLEGFKAEGKLDKPYACKPKEFVVWKTKPEDPKEEKTNCLVLQLNSPELIKRHEHIMKEFGATFDFDKYTPHITLSYSIGDMDIENLPKIDFDLVFDTEYAEELNLNWAKTKGTK
jgi:hypothetical protein